MSDRSPQEPDEPQDPALPPAGVADADDEAAEVPAPADRAAASDGPAEPPHGSASPSPGRRAAAWVGAAALALAAFGGGLAVGRSSADDDGPSHRGRGGDMSDMHQNGPRGAWHDEDFRGDDFKDEDFRDNGGRPPRPEPGDRRSDSDRSDD